MNKCLLIFFFLCCCLTLPADDALVPYPVTTEKIPADLVWLNGMEQKTFASSKAKKGGTWNIAISAFPNTFRQVGINANGSFRRELDNNDIYLTQIHPETGATIPGLAKEWAIGPDKRTVYFRLDPDARWSDAHPVTADDFVFMLEMMRSEYIMSPWYNNYYSKEVETILKFDDHTLAVRLPKAKADLVMNCSFSPKPHHWYKAKFYQQLTIDFETAEQLINKGNLSLRGKNLLAYNKILEAHQQFRAQTEGIFMAYAEEKDPIRKAALEPQVMQLLENKPKNILFRFSNVKVGKRDELWNAFFQWQIQPQTGPYVISDYNFAKSMTMSKVKNWWAKDKKFFKNRYNVDKIQYRVFYKDEIQKAFFSGKTDTYGMVPPQIWHGDFGKNAMFNKGYIHKLKFYHNSPVANMLMTYNTAHPLLAEENVRKGITYSLNLTKVIEDALKGDYQIANSHSEGHGAFTHPHLKSRRFNPKKAVEYFHQAGFTKFTDNAIRYRLDQNGKPQLLSFELLYSSPLHTERLQVLKSEARKLGLELKLKTGYATTVFKKMLSKEHEIAWHGWGAQMRPNYWGQYHSSNADIKNTNNLSNVKDKTLDQLIERYRAALNNEQKVKLAHKIEERLHELCVAHPTFKIPYFREGIWNWVKYPDFIATRTSDSSVTDYGLFWIDVEEKKKILAAKAAGEKWQDSRPPLRIEERYKK